MRLSSQLKNLLKIRWNAEKSKCLHHFLIPHRSVSNVSVRDPASPQILPPLLILHGLFGSKQNWRSLAKAFSERTGRQVITVDARNHGESEHSTQMDYPTQVLDTHHLLQELGVHKAVVMGHSMGGKAAMALALCHPELVDGLIVVDSSPTRSPGSTQGHKNYVKAMKQMNLDIVKSRKDAEQQLIESVPSPQVRAFFLTNLSPTSSGYRWRINLNGIENNLSVIWDFPSEFFTRNFTGKTLFIGGGKSDYIQEQHYPQIFQLFPQAKIRFVADSGHWVHSEKPHEFSDLVMDFLNEG